MTDERQGTSLWAALERLPHGAGVVFRHYGAANRRALYARVRRVARRRGLVLVVAGGERLPGADGVHNRRGRGIRTASAHGVAELRQQEREGADLVFVSPVFPTRSHPNARALGPVRFGLVARHARVPVIALGGMDAGRFRRVKKLGAYGWAAIDAWSAKAPLPEGEGLG
jgi:thiamine-phosphate pyrophosphorylase